MQNLKNKFEKTFDNAAIDYDESRPFYCSELYEDLFTYKSLDKNSRVLEIGIGTGKATLPILETGCYLTALEPGENLAQFTRERFGNYENFELHCKMLQDYECPEESFDLIYAATAFHWIPEEYGYQHVFDLLKHGGAFARFAYHAGPDQERMRMTEEIQLLYQKFLGSTGKAKLYGREEAEALAKIAEKYEFEDTAYRMYQWKKDFTAEEYLRLLRTYPDHMKLEETARIQLFDGIYNVIQKHGGAITVNYVMDMQLARKR